MKIALSAILLILAAPAIAQVDVNGYTKKDGTYVQPHHRTSPNGTNLDNYSTKGNINPYTGQPGTKAPEPFGLQPAPRIEPAQPFQPVRPAHQPQPFQPYQQIQPIQPIQPIRPKNLF